MNGLLTILFAIFAMATGERILVIPAHNIASHTKSMYIYAEALAKQGHEIVVLQILDNEKEQCKSKQKGVLDVTISTVHKLGGGGAVPADILWTRGSTNPIGLIFPWHMTVDVCRAILNTETTNRAFYEILNQHWDAVLVDNLFCPCGIIAAQHGIKRADGRQAIIVDFSTSLLLPKSSAYRGISIPESVQASAREAVFDNRHFFYRVQQKVDVYAFTFMFYTAVNYLIPVWTRNDTSSQIFSTLQTDGIARASHIAYVSMPYALNFAAPIAADIVETDVDCPKYDPNAELPEPYESFVNDPTSKGTILMAMGHFIDWKTAPQYAVDAFTGAFALLKSYRVIWQFPKGAVKPNVTSNVLLDAWLPQVPLLYDDNTKVFISHMGYKSMREAICAKVPIAALPMFAEQYRNTALVQWRKTGVFLDKTRLSAKGIYDTLMQILENNSYKLNAEKLQSQLDDYIRHPQEVAVFRLEYLMRHGDIRKIDKFVSMKIMRRSCISLSLVDVGAFVLAILGAFATIMS